VLQGSANASRYRWASLNDDELLRLRFSQLRLRLKGSLVEPELDSLHAALQRRGLRFRPHAWLSTEWFSPDGVPGIAIPFYAAHPRLRRLEQRMIGEVEGASRKWRMRILRHEAGHALDTAFRLRRRASWRHMFGPASRPYPARYRARPASRDHVLHLGYWYAQSHPTEDFAETFAVWLQPKARWRRDYTDWPALEKLEYVDELMRSLAGMIPPNRDRSMVAPLADNQRTLGEYYTRKRSLYDSVDRRYDEWIRDTFTPRRSRPQATGAARFMAALAPQLKRLLQRRTRVSEYLIDHVMRRLLRRARALDLVAVGPTRDTRQRVVTLHERVIYDMLHRDREHFVL
jgi:hypothetical protein